jgi:hypothetical protein
MVGMGAIVTKDVAPFHLVIGAPARTVGAVCRCGTVVHRGDLGPAREVDCPTCGRAYGIAGGAVLELERAPA